MRITEKKSKNYKDVAKRINQNYKDNLTAEEKELSEMFVLATFEAITQLLKEGYDVYVSDFGRFHVGEVDARIVRHPATGEMLNVPAGHRITFSLTKALREYFTKLPVEPKDTDNTDKSKTLKD